MSAFYLRVEGVNLGQFVYDTQDLSTIRGGGLMLLDAPREVERILATLGKTPYRITTGASQAILKFEAGDPAEAGKVRDQVAEALREIVEGTDPLKKLGHATFVVDVCPGADYSRQKEELIARNRWRQMRQLRVVPPPENQQPQHDDNRPYCAIDLIRPATAETRSADDQRISVAVEARREYGRHQKQEFYQRCFGYDGPTFANDFHQIAARKQSRWGVDEIAVDPLASLHAKMAVFYADGNNFSALQRQCVVDEATQEQWDRHVQVPRKEFMEALLAQCVADDLRGCRWRFRDSRGSEKIRLETLLWGGDELILVVPAWKGWAVAQLFFEIVAKAQRVAETKAPVQPVAKPMLPAGLTREVRNLNAPRSKPKAHTQKPKEPLSIDAVALTYGCGLVFCHDKAPVQRIIGLAKSGLAEFAKNVTKRKSDGLAVAVLESFDQLDQDFQASRQAHLPSGTKPEDLILSGGNFASLTADLQTMIGQFPRGAVYKILRALRSAEEGEFKYWLQRAEREAGEVPARFKGGNTTDAIAWLHLADLWDYLPKEDLGHA